MDNSRIEEIAKEAGREAGREAVREMLIALGIDASTPDGIKAAQRNFLFLDDLVTGTEAVKRKVWLTVIGAIVTALLAYVALGFKQH
jgi:hypothetical protein